MSQRRRVEFAEEVVPVSQVANQSGAPMPQILVRTPTLDLLAGKASAQSPQVELRRPGDTVSPHPGDQTPQTDTNTDSDPGADAGSSNASSLDFGHDDDSNDSSQSPVGAVTPASIGSQSPSGSLSPSHWRQNKLLGLDLVGHGYKVEAGDQDPTRGSVDDETILEVCFLRLVIIW